MRKRMILTLVLAAVLLVTSGCGLIVKDAEVDKQTVIVEVAGKSITKQEVTDAANSMLGYWSYYYSMSGYPFDMTDADTISEAQDSAIDGLIQTAVVEQKEREMGFLDFTDEELAAMQATVDEAHQDYFDTTKTNYFADTELTGEALDQAVEARMAELGYATREEALESEKTNAAYDKLKAEVVKDVAVTDEEIQTDYDAKLENAKARYLSDLSAYGTDVSNGATIYYVPAGYRYVKHILLKLAQEDSDAISELEAQKGEKDAQLANVQASLSELPADATTDTEEQAASRKALDETKATLDEEIAQLQKQIDERNEAAFAAIQPKVDEVLQKLAEGGDFDELVATYGEDSGMTVSPAKEQGYLVCEGYTGMVEPFVTGAMALASVGDVSPAVRSTFGVHIIKYESDVAEAETPIEDVRETIMSSLLTTKQDTAFNEQLDAWVTEANAKIYKDRMK